MKRVSLDYFLDLGDMKPVTALVLADVDELPPHAVTIISVIIPTILGELNVLNMLNLEAVLEIKQSARSESGVITASFD